MFYNLKEYKYNEHIQKNTKDDSMFIRAYLRASTDDQDATRAKNDLITFAESQGHKIANFYIENESGGTLQRPELMRLIADAQNGDVLLVEQVDRLARLTESDWQFLRTILKQKGILVVSIDLPTSHAAMASKTVSDDFTMRILSAINDMMLDVLAAVARKDYEDRRRRQNQGIQKAKIAGAYKGRPVNEVLHQRVKTLLDDGKSIRKIAELLNCSISTVQRVKKLIS